MKDLSDEQLTKLIICCILDDQQNSEHCKNLVNEANSRLISE